MSSMWDILGLSSPSADIRQIKSAYKIRLEALQEKGDDQGLIELERAFKEASKYSKSVTSGQMKPQPIESSPTNTDAILEAERNDLQQQEAYKFIVEENGEALICSDFKDECFDQIYALLNNPWNRVNEHAWGEFFDYYVTEDDQFSQDFRELFRKALLYHYGYFSDDKSARNKSFGVKDMPGQVSTYIFHRMGWLKRQKMPVNIKSEIDWLRRELDVGTVYKSSDFNPIADTGLNEWGHGEEYQLSKRDVAIIFGLIAIYIIGLLIEGF